MMVKKKSVAYAVHKFFVKLFFLQRLNNAVRNLLCQKYFKSYVTCCEKIPRLLLTAGGLPAQLMDRITKSAVIRHKAIASYLSSYNEVFNYCSLLEIIRFGYGIIYNQWKEKHQR